MRYASGRGEETQTIDVIMRDRKQPKRDGLMRGPIRAGDRKPRSYQTPLDQSCEGLLVSKVESIPT